jgi:hypothetical protein
MDTQAPIWSRTAVTMPSAADTGHRYGRYRWTVTLETNTAVEVDCDDVEFTPSGGLVFYGTFALDVRQQDQPPRRPTLAFAAGQWRYAYATSTACRRPLAAQAWPGHVS